MVIIIARWHLYLIGGGGAGNITAKKRVLRRQVADMMGKENDGIKMIDDEIEETSILRIIMSIEKGIRPAEIIEQSANQLKMRRTYETDSICAL